MKLRFYFLWTCLSVYCYCLFTLLDVRGVEIGAGEKISFDVVFRPASVKRFLNDLLVSLNDNPYGDSVIHLIGEGYQAEITLDNMLAANEEAMETVEDNVPGRSYMTICWT